MSLAVRIVSLLLTLTIFLLAALHVAYLVAAFDLRDQARSQSKLLCTQTSIDLDISLQLLKKASTGEIEESSYQVVLTYKLKVNMGHYRGGH